ncbi:DUF5343 domain-containing protein [Homoserinibacter sp. GY 40078]|uniref:DUF5343 domain-containing protein n=1 Tax=Homoserinibacter sp. GY 40078 TaxID=2603275 RepID=UPI0011C7C768|nr:DUF5343 domain-containing protein [Homoserinibacter sp. GY 40078]TXK18649.1 hypothetical protein FVQ89_01490 [Homoserinibacter sp. GY 40078]
MSEGRSGAELPAEMPYMPSVVNVGSILEKIKGAGTPPKFTHDFLKSTLGFSSSNDRAMIKVLRTLGFISADSTPTQRYNDFKGEHGGQVLAVGLREGWADLFMADQKVNEKSVSQVGAIVKSVTGAGDAVAKKTASTFKALSDKADWTAAADAAASAENSIDPLGDQRRGDGPGAEFRADDVAGSGLLRLHHDIHIHLPPSSDVAVYRAIFQALKAELM